MNSLGILNQMFSAYPNTPISEEGIVVYVRLLQDIPTADLQTVVDQAIATFKFPPTIAEIRDMYHGLQHVDQLSWTEAWETVQKEIRRIGSWGVPQFTDSLTTRVVQAMGWKTLCASDNPARFHRWQSLWGVLQVLPASLGQVLLHPYIPDAGQHWQTDGDWTLPDGELWESPPC
jgi:hypothetical protein